MIEKELSEKLLASLRSIPSHYMNYEGRQRIEKAIKLIEDNVKKRYAIVGIVTEHNQLREAYDCDVIETFDSMEDAIEEIELLRESATRYAKKAGFETWVYFIREE